MKTLIIGATGYLGSAICRKLHARGLPSYGLARSREKVDLLRSADVIPVEGSLDDPGSIGDLLRGYDLCIWAAMMPFEDEQATIKAIVDEMKGSGRHFLMTSGTGVLSIAAPEGEWDENTFAEDDPFPFPARRNREIRIETENRVRDASGFGLHTTVIRPPLIWGNGGSVQIPRIFESAIDTGSACFFGKGLNLYSNVHVDDLAEAYCLAIEKGTPGALYHTVAGEANFRSLAEAVAEVVECGTRSVDSDEAFEIWTPFFVETGLAVNSRSRAPRTRDELGWNPEHLDVIEDIRLGSYRAAYERWKAGGSGMLKISSHG